MSNRSTMTIDFKEAEFLALLFDATFKQLQKQMVNVDDFVTAQCFMGNDIDADEEEIRYHMETVSHEMMCIRSRIREEFGI